MIFRNIGGLKNKYFNFEQVIQFANKNKKIYYKSTSPSKKS